MERAYDVTEMPDPRADAPVKRDGIIDDPRDIVHGGRVVDAANETRTLETDRLTEQVDPQAALNPGRMWAEL